MFGTYVFLSGADLERGREDRKKYPQGEFGCRIPELERFENLS